MSDKKGPPSEVSEMSSPKSLISTFHGVTISTQQSIIRKLICSSSLTFSFRESFILKANAHGQTIEMEIEFMTQVDLDELKDSDKPHMSNILNCFNVVVKQALREKKYEQVGRLPKFFLAEDKIDIRNYNLNAWPGYEVTSKLATQGVFLNIDSCTKFVNMTTVLDMYSEKYNMGYTDAEIFDRYNSSNIDNPRITVISSHNSRSYQIDGMSTEFTPLTCRFKQKDGSEVSMSEYFYSRYRINLIDKQPLLYVNQREGRIYIPSQLCNEASLPDDFTKDNNKMRDLQQYKITSAQARKDKIEKLVMKFGDDQTFKMWGVEIESKQVLKTTPASSPFFCSFYKILYFSKVRALCSFI